MKRILHLSDFHINLEMNKDLIEKKIEKLILLLKEKNYDIDILLFSGDIIDQKYINKCLSKENYENKSVLRKDYMRQEFEYAESIFNMLVDELNIKKQKVVICCGNHDKFEGDSKLNTCNDCSYNQESLSIHDFKLFNEFCQKITNRQNNYTTHIRKIDGFNIIVINSNWKNTNAYDGHCINCNEINNIIKNNEQDLQLNLSLNKKRNILLSHAPYDTFCEYTKYEYQENNKEPIEKQIREYIGLFCFGDKHTKHVYNNEYIVGHPLSEDYIVYNLYEFNNEFNSSTHKFIIYDNNDWKIEESHDLTKEIYEISKCYIKKRVYETMFGLGNTCFSVSSDKILNWFKDKSKEAKFDKISDLFKCIVLLRKTKNLDSGERVYYKDNIFEKVTYIINTSSNENPITLRGAARLGKSSMIGYLYMYLLHDFECGKFAYIPVYINLENLILSSDNIKNNFILLKEKVHDVFKNSQYISKKTNIPICFIIDGLSEYNYFGCDIEKFIKDTVQEYMSNSNSIFNKYVFSIDTNQNLRFEKTCIAKEKNADYLLYFDVVNLVNVHTKDDRVKNFLKKYSNVFGINKKERGFICDAIYKLGVTSIDYNFLTLFSNKLKQPKESLSVSELYLRYFEMKIDKNYRELAPKAAYNLCFNPKVTSYVSLDYIDLKTFDMIKDQGLFLNYLVAQYYVNCVKEAVENIDFDVNALNTHFNKSITMFIIDIINNENLHAVFIKFCDNCYKKLDCIGIASNIYILGRITISEEKRKKLFKLFKNQIEEYETKNHYKEIGIRSIYISEITSHPNTRSYSDDYIKLLLQSYYQRSINRSFHKLYYGDISYENFKGIDEINEGFDFFNTFHYLASRINNYVKNKVSYPLLELELFTLCNLIQVRIQKMYVNNGSTLSFFFNSKYPSSVNVITKTIEFLDVFIKYTDLSNDHFLICYFNKMKIDFLNFLQLKKQHNTDYFYHSSTLFEKLSKLDKVEKIGWKIYDNHKTITEEEINRLSRPSCETTLEHTYNTYLMGLLYLPNNMQGIDINDEDAYIKYDNYDKQKILNTILIHDLGENEVGDYPPFYENYEDVLKREDEFNKNIFLSGTYDDVADLFEYYDLWRNWYSTKKDDINTILAKELDKIQMLYKYHTLILEGKVYFTDDRKKAFLESKKSIASSIGKKIYKIVVENNPKFKNI